MASQAANKVVREQSRGDDPSKREAIIEAARTLFTTKGYEATTMAEVARQSGVGVGTVYLYFKNKSDLIYGVKGEWDLEFLRFMTQPEIQAIPHHLRARPFIEAAFALCEQHTDMVQLMGMQPEMVGDWYTKDGSKIEQALQAFFEDGIEAGAFRPIDSKAAAIIAFGMVHQALLQCFLVEDGKEKQRYIDTLVDAMEQWLLR